MFIATRVIFDPETFKAIPIEGYEYEGPLAEAKKGREAMGDLTTQLQGLLKQYSGNGQQSYDTAQGLLKQDIGSSAPGSLTPAASAQLASDNDNIQRTYNGMRQTAMATAGQRGLGSAPSGFEKTTENSIAQGQGNASAGAYRNAQENTQQQRNFATSGEMNLSGQQTGAGLGAGGEAITGAADQSKMGSTAGDILGGVAGVAGALPGVGGLFSKIGQKISPSGVGGYGGAS